MEAGGQAADTLVYDNVAAMWARLYGPCRKNAVWLVSQDVEPQLQKMFVATGTSSGQLVYMPPGGVSQSGYDTLFGRPVIPTEHCSQLGDEGDVILWDPKSFLSAVKGSVRNDISIHVYFDTDHVAYRWIMRIGGRTLWDSKVSPEQGSLDMSTVITLNSSRT